ncbi:MAG: DUF4062 domain-containing protein [Actinomycetota bacterium]|nr:DUF4062 domain-containing protein [Actinomycetota bacterium]
MKVFVSSVISGFEAERDAVATAVAALGHIPVRVEDYPAIVGSAQAACLAGIRAADVVILIIGERYGAVQLAGLSATHEEYREARDSRPLLVFIQQGGSPEPKQAAFIEEVQAWERGSLTAPFGSTEGLRDAVTRALHEHVLAIESGSPDETQMIATASSLLENRLRPFHPTLELAVSSGPRRAVLRPSELESNGLSQFLVAEALTGQHSILAIADGTEVTRMGEAIELRQSAVSRMVRLDEGGNMLVRQPVLASHSGRTGIPSIIEEDIHESIQRTLKFFAVVLDRIDPASRLSHVVLATSLVGASYVPWRTRTEQLANPNSATLSTGASQGAIVNLNPPLRRRAALSHESVQIADDLTVQLRRQFRS